MGLTAEDINQIASMLRQSQLQTVEAVKSLLNESKATPLKQLQANYLTKKALTITQITESQLIGNYSRSAVFKKMEHLSYVGPNKKMLVPVELIIKYRKQFNIQ